MYPIADSTAPATTSYYVPGVPPATTATPFAYPTLSPATYTLPPSAPTTTTIPSVINPTTVGAPSFVAPSVTYPAAFTPTIPTTLPTTSAPLSAPAAATTSYVAPPSVVGSVTNPFYPGVTTAPLSPFAPTLTSYTGTTTTPVIPTAAASVVGLPAPFTAYPPTTPVVGGFSPMKPIVTRSYADPARPRVFPARGCCTKALLVGINYRYQGPSKELYGCINDIRCLAQFVEDQGWERQNIVVMDEDQSGERQPTRANMIRMMEWLMEDCRPGDALFFAFSGHATQIDDLSGDEEDYMDEAMVTVDQKLIVDDDLFEILVKRLPEGACLTAITDCCHSGTILDLPYQMRAGHRTRGPAAPPLRGGQVICFSGCQDDQKSGDMDANAGYSGGACTNALLTALSVLGTDVSLGRLLKEMTCAIRDRGMPQVPMISCSLPSHSRDPFSLTPNDDYLRPVPRLRNPEALNPYIDFVALDQHALKRAPEIGSGMRTRGWVSDLIGGVMNFFGGGGKPPAAAAAFSGATAQPQMGGGAASVAIPGEIRMFSGCMDEQTSADVSNVASFGLPSGTGPGGAGGACTNALMAVLHRSPTITWVDLLEQMRQILKTKGYTQIPQLSSSRPIDLKSQFQLTQSGGRHRALMVGINYRGQQGQLSGCINDVLTMKQFLEKHGFNDFRVMADDGSVSREMPTKANILAGFAWLVEGAQPGDSLFFHYSGHGSNQRDWGGDEPDGRDETMVPLDYNTAGMIVDDDILARLVMKIPNGAQLTCVMDCCHSGTILDLPYTFVANQSNTAQAARGSITTTAANSGFNPQKLQKLQKLGAALFQQAQASGLFKKK